jgi:hypothetical protein
VALCGAADVLGSPSVIIIGTHRRISSWRGSVSRYLAGILRAGATLSP